MKCKYKYDNNARSGDEYTSTAYSFVRIESESADGSHFIKTTFFTLAIRLCARQTFSSYVLLNLQAHSHDNGDDENAASKSIDNDRMAHPAAASICLSEKFLVYLFFADVSVGSCLPLLLLCRK